MENNDKIWELATAKLHKEITDKESAELDELGRSQDELTAMLQAIEASQAAVEEEMRTRERTLGELDQQMERLLHQRASAVAEEERGRGDTQDQTNDDV